MDLFFTTQSLMKFKENKPTHGSFSFSMKGSISKNIYSISLFFLLSSRDYFDSIINTTFKSNGVRQPFRLSEASRLFKFL
jgi:hypothetical protein